MHLVHEKFRINNYKCKACLTDTRPGVNFVITLGPLSKALGGKQIIQIIHYCAYEGLFRKNEGVLFTNKNLLDTDIPK